MLILRRICCQTPLQNDSIWGVFSTSLRICEKCDFERPSIVFAIFFNFESINFQYQKLYFSSVFLKMVLKLIFIDFGATFTRSWDDLRSKKFSKMRGLGVVFSPCCEYARSVILNDPPSFLLYFSILEHPSSTSKCIFFSCFFEGVFKTKSLSILARSLVQIGGQMAPKIN